MTHIALLIPALNEEQGLVRTARVAQQALDQHLVSSIHVLDGGSTDSTVEIAVSHELEVVHVGETLSYLGPVLGKGDSLFRGVHTIDADWYVFLDADLGNINTDHIAALVTPIGKTQARFVKGGFVRIDENGVPRQVPGGRVTEEYGRPLLRHVSPKLAELTQPLSGQVAIEADVARSTDFVTGYGIEIAMLIDVWRLGGESIIVEADMGEINNRWKPDDALDVVIDDVVGAAALRGVRDDRFHTSLSVVNRQP